VRKETTLLILAFLLGASPVVTAQDISDEDLESLLGDEPVSQTEAPRAEVPTEVTETVEAPSTVEAPIESHPSDTVSIDTIDLDSLDDTPVEPLDTVVPVDPPVVESVTVDDDLESLRADLDDEEALKPLEPEVVKTIEPAKPLPKTPENVIDPEIFDVGKEERELLSLAQNIQGQITNDEWNEVATAAKASSYTVVPNDWLFKISKRFFGTGHYYPKIWSINSFISNPHFIEPGMVLSFTTGSGSVAPDFKLGTFTEDELFAKPGSAGTGNFTDLSNFGDDAEPAWLDEKNELAEQGVYFQYASEETMDDLNRVSQEALNKEYEAYSPPVNKFDIEVPSNYDRKTGFDKNSRILYSFKEGFYLSTFVSTNIVQDFGSIVAGPDENIFFTKADRAYVKFDESVNALPGDRFSVYSSGGIVKHENSDRKGYKYTIVAQIKLIRKIQDKWEVEFTEVVGTPQRGDRITVYTPKIDRITKTYNSRIVEAAILGSFHPGQAILGVGDVIYLDRGRADGLEMGNVLQVFGFKDRLNSRNITNQPTYKTGELAVITLTDNFATALVTSSNRDFYAGDIAITKTKEAHLRELNAKEANARGEKDLVGGKALDELDVELNLENLNDDLLREADKIQLTEDELAELERQEREKSVIKDSERDLKALERLENEIEHAEEILNDAKLDEDKLLENQNLNEIEKNQGNLDQDSLDEIEENLGKRYIDEDLNSKDNPFGLTEFDVEEIDELLNTTKENQ
jgi:nucleoid-associated protein YgaU